MTEETLTPERILDVAEDVLRRYGPAKATVVDVARALGVSHGSVYRHFPSKAALRDAVTERWLARVSDPLTTVVTEDGSATARLRRWFDLLIAAKKSRAFDDPEMFATYMALATDARDVVKAHVAVLAGQIIQLIADGITQGEFTANDAAAMGWAVYYATSRFHDPVHAAWWSDPASSAAFEGVWSLVLYGLGVRRDRV